MQVESFHLSPVEKELSFNLWRQNRNIKLFLLDFDDTICDTQPIFNKQVSKAVEYLTKNSPIQNKNIWEKEIRTNNNKSFEQYGVNPNKWDLVVDSLEAEYHLRSEVSDQTKEIFQSIYTIPLQMKAGAKEGLDFLKNTNTPFAIVTHANKNWTWRKYNWLGLDKYLNWDDVYIVNENGHKTAQSWQEALNYFKLESHHCAVIGDSPRSDINPSVSIGIKHCFWIKNPSLWSLQQQPVPPETIILNDLSEITNIGYQYLTDLKPRRTIL